MNRRSISRRTMLRGLGGAMALPSLEIMTPRGFGSSDPASAPPLRTGFFYIPNGVIPESWWPAVEGRDFQFPSSLAPLEPVREEITVLGGLDRVFAGGTDVHAQCGSCWLTSAAPGEKPDGMFPIDVTVDQLIASRYSEQTLFPSLELSGNGFTDNKESKYFQTISWYGPGASASPETNPRSVYRRLFGLQRVDPIARSILDLVREDARALRGRLGKLDRRKVDEYFESVRGIERRLDRLESRAFDPRAIPLPEPAGVPEARSEHIRLMADLIVLAFQLDLSRVATLMIGPERWGTPLWYDGVSDKPIVHHTLTHNVNKPEAKVLVQAIDRFHAAQFAYVVDRLRNIPDGAGVLLDHCALVFGAGLGNGSLHNYDALPTLLAGRACGAVDPGRSLRFAPGTPLANLWLSLLRMHGDNRPRIADSTSPLHLT